MNIDDTKGKDLCCSCTHWDSPCCILLGLRRPVNLSPEKCAFFVLKRAIDRVVLERLLKCPVCNNISLYMEPWKDGWLSECSRDSCESNDYTAEGIEKYKTPVDALLAFHKKYDKK